MTERTMRPESLIKELGSTIILQGLKARELKRFARICELRDYESGDFLVEQDAVGTDLHILLAGTVDIVFRGPRGKEVRAGEVRKGDVLGEASIFMDLPRTASARARSSCLVAAVGRDRLFGFCKANPRAGLKIFGFVIYSLLKRLGATNRELAAEREAVVTAEDLERLGASLPKSLEDILGR